MSTNPMTGHARGDARKRAAAEAHLSPEYVAQTLRDAAAKMRQQAQAACVANLGHPSPVSWHTAEGEGQNRDQRRTLGQFTMIHDGEAEIALVRGFSGERRAVAAHIASWHPVVALAVADWLDGLVEVMTNPAAPSGGVSALREEAAALALARAYLGGDL